MLHIYAGVEVLCEIEAHLPDHMLTPLMHSIMHFPEQVHRWNNVHNTWCFFMEQLMAHLKGFVHNAREPAETLIQRISVEKVLQCVPASIRNDISLQCAHIGSSERGIHNSHMQAQTLRHSHTLVRPPQLSCE